MIFVISIRANKDLSAKSRTVAPFQATASIPSPFRHYDQTWICKFLPGPIENLLARSLCFSLNGTHLGLPRLHVTHSKDERGSESGLRIPSNLFIFNDMAERVGFELTSERKFKDMQRTGCAF